VTARPRAWLPLLALAALLAGAVLAQRAIDARFAAGRPADSVVYLVDGRLLGRLAPAFRHVLADLYWLRALQYYGTHHSHQVTEAGEPVREAGGSPPGGPAPAGEGGARGGATHTHGGAAHTHPAAPGAAGHTHGPATHTHGGTTHTHGALTHTHDGTTHTHAEPPPAPGGETAPPAARGRGHQAAGGHEAGIEGLVYRLLAITTDLDPRFGPAYTYGGHFLAHHGSAAGLRLALALLDKGVEANPGDWRLRFDRGFVHYFYARDYPAAAADFAAGSRLPGAPPWLAAVAARSRALAGDRATARQLLTYVRDTVREDSLRLGAEVQLAQLDALDRRDELERLVARYRAREGRPPAAWADLVGAGLLREPPRDPAGVPFALDPASGRVRIARDSPLAAAPGN
jgi:hypothetical protein